MAKGDYPKYYDGDLICSACSEPWEKYSIDRLEDDWTAPQVAAFKAGQGCPSCLSETELTRLGEEILAKEKKGPNVCDGCLTAVYDEGEGIGLNRTAQILIATTMGADIADHNCEDPDNCNCACRAAARRARDLWATNKL